MNEKSLMSYRGFDLTLCEGTEFHVENGGCAYVVSSDGKMTFRVSSDVGVNYSSVPQQALADHQRMIDRHLSSRDAA